MKLFPSVMAAATMTFTASAQQGDNVMSAATLLLKDDKAVPVVLVEVTPSKLIYKKTARSARLETQARAGVKSIYLSEPKAYTRAMALYKDRKYGQAEKGFAKTKTDQSKFLDLPGNYSTLAGFYELESLRKQLKTGDLVKKLANFQSENLMNPQMKQQMQIYKFWEEVNSKSWAAVDKLAQEWSKKILPGSQRAQIEYCHGLALEGLKRPVDAIDAFSKAMSADYGKSEVITRNAAQAALRVYAAMPGIENGEMLDEARSLAKLYQKVGLGAGVTLPKEFAIFAKPAAAPGK